MKRSKSADQILGLYFLVFVVVPIVMLAAVLILLPPDW